MCSVNFMEINPLDLKFVVLKWKIWPDDDTRGEVKGPSASKCYERKSLGASGGPRGQDSCGLCCTGSVQLATLVVVSTEVCVSTPAGSRQSVFHV